MHKLIAWLSENFVPVWKTISIALTGAFGVLGLLTEFKNKHTKKITTWGYISLIGIVVSSSCGVWAQLRENQDDAKKALALAENTDHTLSEIQRGLVPIKNLDIEVGFKLPCEVKEVSRLCSLVRQRGEMVGHDFWGGWPGGTLYVDLDFYKDRVKGHEYVPEGLSFRRGGDLSAVLSEPSPKPENTITAQWHSSDKFAELFIRDTDVEQFSLNSAAVSSMLDFHGVTLIVTTNIDGSGTTEGLQLTGVRFASKNSKHIQIPPEGSQFRELNRSSTSATFVYHFPENL